MSVLQGFLQGASPAGLVPTATIYAAARSPSAFSFCRRRPHHRRFNNRAGSPPPSNRAGSPRPPVHERPSADQSERSPGVPPGGVTVAGFVPMATIRHVLLCVALVVRGARSSSMQAPARGQTAQPSRRGWSPRMVLGPLLGQHDARTRTAPATSPCSLLLHKNAKVGA